MLKKYYEKKQGSAKGYYILVMEVSVMLGLFTSIASKLAPQAYYLNTLFLGLLLYSLYCFKKEKYPQFTSHAVLFTGLFAFALLTPWLMNLLSASLVTDPFSTIKRTGYLALSVIIAFIIIRTAFRKKTVEGKVTIADKDKAVVKIDYDIFAGIKAGEYIVKNNKAKKGDKVIVKLKTSFLKGAVPSEIVMKKRRRRKRKGLISIDAVAAIILLLMVMIVVQNYAVTMTSQAKEYGTALQAKAASVGMGSRMNALKALGLGAADYYNARSKVPVISVTPTEYQEADISKNKGENTVHTMFGEYDFTYPAPLDYYYYDGCIASNPAVFQSACKTSLPECTVKFRHCTAGKSYFESDNSFSVKTSPDSSLLTSYSLGVKTIEYSGQQYTSANSVDENELVQYFEDTGIQPPDFFPADSQEFTNFYTACLHSLPKDSSGAVIFPTGHLLKGKENSPYANTYTISCGYRNRGAGPLTSGTAYFCSEDPGKYEGYCFPLYTIGGNCDIRPEPNLNYYPEREVCE